MANSKDLLAKFNKAFNAHDLDGLDAITADNAVLTTPTGQIRGKAAIRAYNQSWFNAFPDAKLQVVRQVVEGDVACEEGRFIGTHTGTLNTPTGDIPSTGRKIDGPYCGITVYKNGLGVESRLYFDQVDLLTQLGLMPELAGAGAR